MGRIAATAQLGTGLLWLSQPSSKLPSPDQMGNARRPMQTPRFTPPSRRRELCDAPRGTAAAGVSLQMFAAVRDVSKGLPRVSESFLMLNFQENCALSRSNLPKCASLFSVLPCLHEGLSGQVVLARASQCHLRQKSFPQGLIQGARPAVTETQAACKADFGHRVRGT